MFLHWPWARIKLYRLCTFDGIWRARAGEAARAASNRASKLRIVTVGLLLAAEELEVMVSFLLA